MGFSAKGAFFLSRLPLTRELPSISEAEGVTRKYAQTTPQSPAVTAPLTRGARNAGKIDFRPLGSL